MNNLIATQNYIPPMSALAIDKVRQLEAHTALMPQRDIDTSHVIHGGMYARTIMIPAGVMLTGALIKIATILIVNGDVLVYIGDDTIELHGYNVLPASANRKQAFIAKTDTYLTMIFSTDVKTVRGAEEQFTDDFELLISLKDGVSNQIIITGE